MANFNLLNLHKETVRDNFDLTSVCTETDAGNHNPANMCKENLQCFFPTRKIAGYLS